MLIFNATWVLPLYLQLCLRGFEDSSSHTTIFVPTSSNIVVPTFSKPILVLDPSRKAPLFPPAERNSVLFVVAGTSLEHLRLLFSVLRPQRFAEALVVLQTFPVDETSAKELLAKSNFSGCFLFLELTDQTECRPLVCDRTPGRQVRIPGIHWPPMLSIRPPFRIGEIRPLEDARGLFGNIYKTVEEKLHINITLELLEEKDCTEEKIIPIEKLINGSLDFICIPFTAEVNPFMFSLSNVLIASNSVWAVPRAKPIKSMLNLVLPFHAGAWISVFATVCAIWLVGRFLAGLSSTHAFVDAISTMLGASSGSLKTAPRLAVIGIRVGCFILVASYQSKLSSILTVPVFEPQIVSPRQLITATNLQLYRLCYHEHFLVDDDDPMKPMLDLRTHMTTRPNMLADLEKVAKGKAALLGPQLVMQYMRRKSPKLHQHVLIQRDIESFLHVGFITRKGDPLVSEINKVIGQMNMAGLVVKWRRDVLPSPKSTQIHELKIRVTMSHLAGAFLLWIIGLAAAFLAFLFEAARLL